MPSLASSRRGIAAVSHLWRVWRANARASIVREMEFRENFLLGLVRQLLWFAIFIIFIDVMFSQTDVISGWSQAEVLVVLALSRLVEGIMNTLFVSNWMRFTSAVNKGEFDFYLLKPVPTQFYTGFRHLTLDNISGLITGLGLLVYALAQPGVQTSLLMIVLGSVIVVIGIVIYYALLVTVASLVFVLERLEALWGFNELFSEPLTVPFDIFPSGVRIALTYLLPIAFVVFIPAQAITGRLNLWLIPIGVGLAIIAVTVANLAWRAGLRRYSSASS